MRPPIIDATDPNAISAATEVLRDGGLVVLPTDTVYGLAANAGDPEATAKLFERKGRTEDTPIAVLAAATEAALALVDDPSAATEALALKHWPGALTMVLRRRKDLDWQLGEPSRTIGLRVPDHDLVRAIAASVGPLATTSANRHGVPTPATANEAAKSLIGRVDLIIDGGALANEASTVAEVAGTKITILRQGAVTFP